VSDPIVYVSDPIVYVSQQQKTEMCRAIISLLAPHLGAAGYGRGRAAAGVYGEGHVGGASGSATPGKRAGRKGEDRVDEAEVRGGGGGAEGLGGGVVTAGGVRGAGNTCAHVQHANTYVHASVAAGEGETGDESSGACSARKGACVASGTRAVAPGGCPFLAGTLHANGGGIAQKAAHKNKAHKNGRRGVGGGGTNEDQEETVAKAAVRLAEGGGGRAEEADLEVDARGVDFSGTERVDAVVAQLQEAWLALHAMLKKEKCGAIMLRLAWHDASSFDAQSSNPWPLHGGVNGSIRLVPEIDYSSNKGLAVALSLLNPLLDRFDKVSAADLFQMAGAAAVEACGGPHIALRYGRRQTNEAEHCCPQPRAQSASIAAPPFPDGADSAAAHVRRVFSRMGLSDEEAVALMGAHTLGRAHRSRSGYGAAHTPYTKDNTTVRPRGGSSWTREWDRFIYDILSYIHVHIPSRMICPPPWRV